MANYGNNEEIDATELLRENVENETLYLVEDYTSIRLDKGTIKESVDASGQLVITAEGEFGFCGKPTANGRRYGKRLMEEQIARLQSKISAGTLLGELDHPDDGMTKAERAAIKITKLRVEPSGRVVGAFEVLSEKVPRAKTLRGLVESGVMLGVSSRGLGSVKKSRDGFYDVQSDYRLLTYDVVVDPAWRDALPEYNVVGESQQPTDRHFTESAHRQESVMAYTTLDEIKRDNPSAYRELQNEAARQAREQLDHERTMMNRQLAEAVSRTATETRDQVRKELEERYRSSNPDKIMSESDAVRVVQEKLDKLKARNHDLAEVASVVREKNQQLEESLLLKSMELEVAKHVAFIPEKYHQSFFNLLGEAELFSTFEQFEVRIDGVVEEFDRLGRYNDNLAEELQEAKEKNAELQERLAEGEALIAESVEAQENWNTSRAELQEAVDTRKSLLGEAQVELNRLTQENKDLKSKLDEAKKLIAESLAAIEEKDDLLLTTRNEIAESYDEIESLSELVESTELELYRHQQVIGSASPVSMLESLKGAESKNDVDSLVEELQAGRRPTTQIAPGGQLTTQALVESQGGSEQFTRRNDGGTLVNVRRAMGASRSSNPEVQRIVQESVGGAPKSGRKAIPGLSAEKMASLIS